MVFLLNFFFSPSSCFCFLAVAIFCCRALTLGSGCLGWMHGGIEEDFCLWREVILLRPHHAPHTHSRTEHTHTHCL